MLQIIFIDDNYFALKHRNLRSIPSNYSQCIWNPLWRLWCCNGDAPIYWIASTVVIKCTKSMSNCVCLCRLSWRYFACIDQLKRFKCISFVWNSFEMKQTDMCISTFQFNCIHRKGKNQENFSSFNKTLPIQNSVLSISRLRMSRSDFRLNFFFINCIKKMLIKYRISNKSCLYKRTNSSKSSFQKFNQNTRWVDYANVCVSWQICVLIFRNQFSFLVVYILIASEHFLSVCVLTLCSTLWPFC